jgi:hypothetical protein
MHTGPEGPCVLYPDPGGGVCPPGPYVRNFTASSAMATILAGVIPR